MSSETETETYTETGTSPVYEWSSRKMVLTLVTATALVTANVGIMYGLIDTVLSNIVLELYQMGAIVGVIVVGAGLSIGHHYGIKGLTQKNTAYALVGLVISQLTYGAFGAAIFSLYTPTALVEGIISAGAITVLITIGAGVYVYATEGDKEQWASYSGTLFGIGLVGALIGTFFEPILVGAFFLFLLGFICNLVFEVWKISGSQRTPLANGFGLYISVVGVFIHVIQLVVDY